MSDPKPSFVYVTYIASTADRVWTALTDGKFTREYWGGRVVESDWQVGSPVRFRKGDAEHDVVRGTVLECERPSRLVMSWAYQPTLDEPFTPASRVTFTIKQVTPVNVRLSIVHEEYEPGSDVDDRLREGWSAILSSLKSYLETGEALDATKRWAAEGRS